MTRINTWHQAKIEPRPHWWEKSSRTLGGGEGRGYSHESNPDHIGGRKAVAPLGEGRGGEGILTCDKMDGARSKI